MDTKRTKGVYHSNIVTKDLYKYYINNIRPMESLAGGKTRGSYLINQTEYSNILKDINLSIIRAMILENYELKLPCRMGTFSIKQKKIKFEVDGTGTLKTKGLSVDHKATKDLWKSDEESRNKKTLIFHTNEHTNGNRMTYWWSKKGTIVSNLRFYYFIPARQIKRLPAQFLKDKDYDLSYFEPIDRKPTRNKQLFNSLNLK